MDPVNVYMVVIHTRAFLSQDTYPDRDIISGSFVELLQFFLICYLNYK